VPLAPEGELIAPSGIILREQQLLVGHLLSLTLRSPALIRRRAAPSDATRPARVKLTVDLNLKSHQED
jgi:hypothetical protein